MKKHNKRRFRQITKILLKHKLHKGLTPVKVREALEDLGPTYVKLGQLMSTREDMLPVEYCLELEKLKENVKPMAFDTVLDVIKNELNCDPYDVFESIDEVPIGSASIGQVHTAHLHDGTKVVIKVMRPGIYDMVVQDFAILKKAIKYLNLVTDIHEVVDLNIILDETFEAMKLEMDFVHELENIKIFTENHKDVKYIKLPKPNLKYTTKQILVMEYIEGFRITDLEQIEANGYDRVEICSKMVENFIVQIVEHGVFHADPHSGNVLISEGKIVWLDLGMIGIINKRDQELYKRAIKAVIKNDIYELKNVVLTLGVCRHEINHAKLYQDIEKMLFKYAGMDINDMDMGMMFQELMGVARNNGISLPKGLTLLGRSILIMQRVVSVLDPNTNLLNFFKNHLQDNYKDQLDPKKLFPDTAIKTYRSASKLIEIPAQIGDLLDLSIKGQSHINVEIVNLRDNVNKQVRASNRLTIGLIIASMILSLGIVFGLLIYKGTGTLVTVLSILFAIFGVLLIFILVVVLIFMLLKERKK